MTKHNEMIERVARAIYDEHYLQGYTVSMPGDLADAFAKAALRAMREPAKKMLVNAGPMEGFDCIIYEDDIDRPHIEWWQAMIDAALEG